MTENVFQLIFLVQNAFKVLKFYVNLVDETVRSIVPVVFVEYAGK